MAQKKATKRLQISKAQQITMIEVMIASLIVGAALVFGIWLVKYIEFNSRVIAEKDTALTNYEKTIIQVGVCVDSDGNGKISNNELEKCDPNTVNTDEVPKSLRYNVLVNMADNEKLESVGQSSLSKDCYEDTGKRINYSKKYNEAQTDSDRAKYLTLMKTCSALRVIPDALPANKNIEATMASLNQIFLLSGLEPEGLTANDADGSGTISNVQGNLLSLPLSWSVETSLSATQRLLENLERSIREYSAIAVNFEWSSNGIVTSTKAQAFYMGSSTTNEQEETVYGNSNKKPTKQATTKEEK